MILNFTMPRMYVCQYMKGGKACSFKFIPGDNRIPASEEKALLAHPATKRKLDKGILVMKNRVTEDLSKAVTSNHEQAKKVKEAAEAKKVKEAKAKAEAEANNAN